MRILLYLIFILLFAIIVQSNSLYNTFNNSLYNLSPTSSSNELIYHENKLKYNNSKTLLNFDNHYKIEPYDK